MRISKKQGKSYDRWLIEELMTIAQTKKVSKMLLKVCESKKIPLKFYPKFGFQILDQLPNYYKTSKGKENALILALNIN